MRLCKIVAESHKNVCSVIILGPEPAARMLKITPKTRSMDL